MNFQVFKNYSFSLVKVFFLYQYSRCFVALGMAYVIHQAV